MFEEPVIHIIDFSSGGVGDDYRAEQARQKAEARQRYLARLEMALIGLGLDADQAPEWGEALLDCLFKVTPVDGGDPCSCSCHPRLPGDEFHDYGFGCACQKTATERRGWWEKWSAERKTYWSSPEGLEERARRQAEEDDLVAWLAGEPDVVVTSYGGMCPEQWSGSVEGRKFYFRERHDHWRIEFDLRPSGRFSKVWKGGDLDDEDSFEPREIEEGDVIAEGMVGMPGYGRTPRERAEFIVRAIRDLLRRTSCAIHASGRADLERRLGVAVSWCPACGERLPDVQSQP
ncbi:MAG: hypothetical protein ACRDYY_14980 [Acidimicrobiales bacterium]